MAPCIFQQETVAKLHVIIFNECHPRSTALFNIVITLLMWKNERGENEEEKQIFTCIQRDKPFSLL